MGRKSGGRGKKEFCQEEARQNLKVGDPIRVKRRGETLMWTSCVNDWDVPHGPVRPDLEQEYIERAQREAAWRSGPETCTLGPPLDQLLWWLSPGSEEWQRLRRQGGRGRVAMGLGLGSAGE